MTTQNKSTVKTTQKTFEIIHALQELGGARIDELSEYLDMASSTVHRHVQTLYEIGYITKEGDHYHLGIRFLTLGGHAQIRLPAFDLAKEKVDQIAVETNERAQFIIEDNGERVYVYTQAGANAVQTDATIGKRGPIHASAAGKAILAALPEPECKAIIGTEPLEVVTPHTITDPEALYKELETVRERGVAFNDQESTVGLRAVAAAISGADGRVHGALSIAGPAHRIKGDLFRSEIPDLLLAVTNEIELKLEYAQ